MNKTFRRDRFTWLAYLMLAFYAYFLNIIGPITPFLKDELHLSYTVSSLHYSAFAVGILLVGLGGHLVIQRLGRRRSLWVGALGMSASVVILLVGQSPVITIGASFCMGLVGSLILAVVPSGLSDRHGEQRAIAISEANVLSSLIATSAPLLVGWFGVTPGGWRWALAVMAVLPVLMGTFLGKVEAPAPVYPTKTEKGGSSLPGLFWVFWAALFLSVSVEFCMVSWSADFLENGLGVMKVDAARAVSLFLGAMIVGRWAGSRLVQRIAAQRLVIGSVLIAAAGFLTFWLGGNAWVAEAGLFLTGLGVANLYPLILSLAMGVAGENSNQASARTTLASGTAILSLPLVMGRMADAVGIRMAYGVVVLLLAAVFLIILGVSRSYASAVEKG